MSKKDFIALADALRHAYQRGELSASVLDDICSFCSGQNWRFNKDRWLGYLKGECGPNGGPVPNKCQADKKASKLTHFVE